MSKQGSSARRRLSRRKRIGFSLVALLLAGLIGEVAARLYWVARADVPFFSTSDIWYRFYPKMRSTGVEPAMISQTDDVLDVLLLGGSVLDGTFGSIGTRLEAGLAERLRRPVHVWNIADIGKTSRDSLLKYRTLGDKAFDLVVFYHSINDLRANNCPSSVFKADYSHNSWFTKINLFQRDATMPWFVLPYTVKYTFIGWLDKLDAGYYIPRDRPRTEWIEFGSDIKTEKPFRAHIAELVETTRNKHERLLLMTFATHIPDDYTLEKFKSKQLAYAEHSVAVETWGSVENVVAGLRRHNAVIESFAERYEDVLFVDQQALMPKRAELFDDCCHLTDAGCRVFVENILAGVSRPLASSGK